MKKKVLIFGTKDLAQMAKFYFLNDSDLEPIAFVCDKEYIKDDNFEGLPVLPFEDIESKFRPRDYLFFVPMTQKKMGFLRKEKFIQAQQKGYEFATYISSKTSYFGTQVGRNCFIFEDNTIQPYTKIGDNVILWSGNHIGHHSIIHDHVFFTSHVVLSGHCNVLSHSFFGVNSTVRDFTTIAEGSLIGMGATITKNTDPYGVYFGNKQIKKEGISSLDLM